MLTILEDKAENRLVLEGNRVYVRSAAVESDNTMAHASLEDSCPAEEDIAAFVGGGLAPLQRSALEAHVAECARCRRLLSALARAAGSESQVHSAGTEAAVASEPGEPVDPL